MDDATMIGEEYGRLYKLKGHPKQALFHESIELSELWHQRLAHVHYRAIPMKNKVVYGFPDIQENIEGICKGCSTRK